MTMVIDIVNNKSFIDVLLEKIPQTMAIMVIDKDGKPVKVITNTKLLEGEIDDAELEFIAKLVGLRYHIADFHKILSSLQMTVNVFRDHCIFVTSFGSEFLIVIITRDVEIEKTRQIISQTKEEYYVY